MIPRGKILLIAPQPFFQWRGSPIRVGFDALALAQLGFEVDLLTMPFGEEKHIRGVRIIRIPNMLLVRTIPIGPSFSKAFFDVLLLIKGVWLALRNHYDFIHGVEEAGALGVFIAKLSGAKLVFEKHSDPSSYRRGKLRNAVMYLYGKMEAFTIRHADSVIGTGPGLVAQAKSICSNKRIYHIFDIPSSLAEINSEKVVALRQKLKKQSEEILITYVGSFAVYQGIDIMFEAIPYVCKRYAIARFIIIGGSPSDIAERNIWLEEHGAGSKVSFIGKVPPDELPDYLAASDILLSPRISGINTPLKLLDYLKAGRAIVATDNTANRQILDENSAILVKANPEAFAEGMCRLIRESELRQMLGERGKRLIQGKYNFDEFKKCLNQCYRDLETHA